MQLGTGSCPPLAFVDSLCHVYRLRIEGVMMGCFKCFVPLILFVSLLPFPVSLVIFPNANYLFWTTNSNALVYQNGTEKWVDLNQSPTQGAINYGSQTHAHLGASYHFARKFLVFSDNGANTITCLGIYSGRLVGTFVHIGASSGVGHVTVDWLSSNVYWSDSIFGWIGLQALPKTLNTFKFNSKFKVVVDKYLDYPSGLAVHPMKGLLFWTDIGVQPKLERSNLDGSSRTVVLWSGLLKPVSVTVDINNDKVYFSDPLRETVESCDTNGNHRKILISKTASSFYGVEIFKSSIFISDQSAKQILALKTSNGQQQANPITVDRTPYSLGMFSEDNQPVTTADCESFGCQHICIHETTGATCHCEDGFILHNDTKTCTAESKVLQRSILIVSGAKICNIQINIINSFKYVKAVIPCDLVADAPSDISHFAVNIADNVIYYSTERVIYRQRIYDSTVSTIYTATSTITGLDYDWINSSLYWTENSRIYVWKVSSSVISNHLTLNINGNPTYLRIDALGRRLFFIDKSSTTSIKSMNLINESIITLESKGLVSPSNIVYNRRKDKVFWSDSGKSSIGSVQSDGKHSKLKSLAQGYTYSGVAVYKDYLFLMSRNTSNLYLLAQENLELSSNAFITMPLASITKSSEIRIYDKSFQPSSKEPCIQNNGGCQHVCIVEGASSKCACNLGYALQSDGKTCLSSPVVNNFFLTIDMQFQKIYQYNRMDSMINALDTLPGAPEKLSFSSKTKTLVWWDSQTKTIRQSSISGTDERAVKAIANVGGLSADISTGNLFYSSGKSIYVLSNTGDMFRKIKSSTTDIGALTVDSRNGLIVWIETGSDPKIVKSFMDGSNTETIISSNIRTPMDVTIDEQDGTVIWCDDTLDKIDIVNLQTLVSKTVISGRGEFPVSVTVDGDNIFYIAKDRRSVTSISKTTASNPQVVFASPVFGKLLHLVTDNGKHVHQLCSNQNGRCSRFCLPKGNNQRVCACEDGVDLQSDGLCPGDIVCPETIDNGYITQQCPRFPGLLCDFACNDGFQKSTTQLSMLFCDSQGNWNATTNICKVVKCTDVIGQGTIASSCDLQCGSSCGYTCNKGFEKAGPSTITCNKNGKWNNDLKTLCRATAEGLSTGAYVGIGSGGGIVLIGIIALVIFLSRRNSESDKSPMHAPDSSAYQGSNDYNSPKSLSVSQSSHYTELSVDNEEVYHEIVEENMLYSKEYSKSTKEPIDVKSSIRSDRYSRFPQKEPESNEYVEPSMVDKNSLRVPTIEIQTPEPDYDGGDIGMSYQKSTDYIQIIRTPIMQRRDSAQNSPGNILT